VVAVQYSPRACWDAADVRAEDAPTRPAMGVWGAQLWADRGRRLSGPLEVSIDAVGW
jgi:hypothetical protein